LLAGNPTAPVELDRRLAGREDNALLQIEILSSGGAETIPVHRNGIGVVIENIDHGVTVPPHGVAARSFNIGRELSRRVHEPHVIAGPRNADHRETRDDHHHGNRDYQLDSAESARGAECRSFHNLWSAPFHHFKCPPAKDGRSFLAMTVPALFKRFLLMICEDVPSNGNSGVTSGDSEWK
jgi:hypothetical protein